MAFSSFRLSVLAVLVAPAALLAQTPFYDYSSSLGGQAEKFTFYPLLQPAGVSSGVSGKTSEWLQGLAPTNNDFGLRFSGEASFPSETTDFLSGGGIYTFFSSTHFVTTETDPKTGLLSLVLQIEIAGQFLQSPTLSLATGAGTQTLAATFTKLQTSRADNAGGFETDVEVYGYQWDLSSVTSPISSYRIGLQVAPHSIIYGEEVTESAASHSASVLQAVPEPGSAALLGLGALLLGARRRRSPARA